MKKPWHKKEYALYKGDTFIAAGTVREIADQTGKSTDFIRYMNTPAYKERSLQSKNKLGLVSLEEEEEDEDDKPREVKPKKPDLFLKRVKVRNFANSTRVYGEHKGRTITTRPNEKPDEVFYVVGVTSIKEGYTEYDKGEGHYFVPEKSHQVYIVAKSIGSRYKALESDLEVLEEVTL